MAGPTALTADTSVDSTSNALASAPELASDAAIQQLRNGVLFLLQREIGKSALAEDLCNEAFRIVFERLARHPLEDPTRLDAYLAQTARNLLSADRRMKFRRRTVTGAQTFIDNIADAESDPSVALQSQSRARAIRRVLREMPAVRDRQLLVRFYLNDEDKADICRDLNLDEKHFNRVIFRARERFRELLDRRIARGDLYCLAIA